MPDKDRKHEDEGPKTANEQQIVAAGGVQKNRVKQPGDGGETRGISISSAGSGGTTGADLNCGPHRNLQEFQRPFQSTLALHPPSWRKRSRRLVLLAANILPERCKRSSPILVIC